ncbi:MAG: TetR/AcrR family transcriptional regulator [Phenylobacterium sp.]
MTVVRPQVRPPRLPGAPAGPRRAEQRRAALVDAAGRLFVSQGVEATTVDDIVEAAGVAKGTFYHYFRSKADLLDALRERFCDEIMRRVGAAVAGRRPDDWPGRLDCWLTEAVHAYFDLHPLHDVAFHGSEMPLREAMGEVAIVQDLAALLAEGARAGAWAAAPPRDTAVLMFYGMHGAADEAIVTGGSAADVAALLRRLYAAMLRKD